MGYNKNFDVRTPVNGEDAIRKLESESFDLLLLDIQMPKMDGLEVLRYIKIRHIDVRPIMLTGTDDLRVRTPILTRAGNLLTWNGLVM